jgi:glycosyltransferase involved in cell wall biosynthesis
VAACTPGAGRLIEPDGLMAPSATKTEAIAVAFVGTAVPDLPQYRSAVFNRAGNTFQTKLIQGIARSVLPDVEVFSARPVQSYPKGPKVWFAAGRDRLDDHITVRLLPFLNVTPIKQAMLGLDVVFSLLGWAWRKREQKRIVLTYNLSVPPAALTLFAARLVRAKAVVSVNDVNVPGETVPTTPLFRLDFALQRWLMPRFDGYLVVADRIAQDFFPGRRYVRIEGGVDTEFLESTERGDASSAAHSPLVLAFAGTLNEVNGVPLILGAMQRLRDTNLQLRIAGSGPCQEMVRDAARQDPRIDFMGMLDTAAVADLYQHSDVLLNIRLTTSVDTRYFFPSKLIEYLGSGVPTITTRVAHADTEFAGLVYVLGEESPQALADLLNKVASLHPEERWKLGRLARTYVSRYKTWDVQSAKAAEYLGSLVGASVATDQPTSLNRSETP